MEQFNILEHMISFSDQRTNYIKAILQFSKMAEEAVEQLKKEYVALRTIKNVAECLEKNALGIYESVISESIKYIQLQKVYVIDEASLKNICDRYFYNHFMTKFEEMVCQPYEELIDDKDEIIEYRKQRKDNRTRWRGYGFGIGGTIVSNAKAGAMNITMGMGHSLVNAVGNIGTGIVSSTKQSLLYNDTRIIDSLAKAMRSVISDISITTMEIVQKNTDIVYEDISQSDQAEADALSNNIIMGRVPKEQEKELLARSLQLNPFNYELLQYATRKYGDEDGELEKLAKFIDYNLAIFKKQLVDDNFGGLGKQVFKTEEELLAVKAEVVSLCKRYGIKAMPYTSILDKKWLEFDIALRTVEGIVYDTRGIARNVEHDIALFEKICSEYLFDDEELTDENSKMELIKAIKNKGYLTEQFKSQIDKRLEYILQPYIYRQTIIKRLMISDCFLEELRQIIEQTDFYKSCPMRIRFSEFTGDKKNKAPAINKEDGVALMYQDLSLFGGWGKGIIITTRSFLIYDKKKVERVSLKEIKTLNSEKYNIVIKIEDENCDIRFDMPPGISNKNVDSYVELIYALIVGILKCDMAQIEGFLKQGKGQLEQKENVITTIKSSTAIENEQLNEMQQIERPPVRREKSKKMIKIAFGHEDKGEEIRDKGHIKRRIYVSVRWVFTVLFLLMSISIVNHGIVASILMVISILFMCPVTEKTLMPQIKSRYLIVSSVVFMYAACMIALLL
uniref:hypothetical protein n=1 Tax=Enterocloster hominis (ex Hitch et al. 2024) TaxID=1917870 RepID=UPI00103012C4|nr:hypothetical protein [Lachnoclostridium pacaense]